MSDYRISGPNYIRTADGALIPSDPGNRDYQIVLAWLLAGNTPDADISGQLAASEIQRANVAVTTERTRTDAIAEIEKNIDTVPLADTVKALLQIVKGETP